MKYVVTLNGMNYEVDVDELNEAIVTDVSPVPAPQAEAAPVAAVPAAAPTAPAPQAEVAAPAPAATQAATGSGTAVKAPMPGTILKVNVSANQAVKEGDVLFILEAMKMENEIVAPINGTISQVIASKGATVATDEALAFIS